MLHRRHPKNGSGQLHTLASFISPSNDCYPTSHPRYKMLCKSIVENLIVKCGLPIAFVDNDGFRKFLVDVDPKYSAPCRQKDVR